jgi:hypothetical protein
MMNFQQYRELCRSASVSLGLEDPDMLANEGYMEKDGVRLALFFDDEIVSDRLICYVDLGPIAEETRTKVFERLLTLNLLSGTKTSGVYTIDPSSGNAIFCVHLMKPERITSDELAGILSAYVDRTIEIQRSLLNDFDDLNFMDTVNRMFDMDQISSKTEFA